MNSHKNYDKGIITMSKLKSTHIVPNPNGGWDIKSGGSKKATKHFDRKSDAVDRGREISRNKKGELFIHGKDGKFQNRDSHGNDPRSSKG
jgi:hypothetical protein